jgi:S1-C subfamily serine protease
LFIRILSYLKYLYDGNVGFVIPGRKILTNAHVVADHTFVLVRKHGSPTKYRAEVQAIGHECDLAILVVESEEFWEGMNFLELGDIPYLQEAVAVVGYPQGNIADILYNSCNVSCICFLSHVSYP